MRKEIYSTNRRATNEGYFRVFFCTVVTYVYRLILCFNINLIMIFRTLRDHRNDKISNSKYILFNTKHQPPSPIISIPTCKKPIINVAKNITAKDPCFEVYTFIEVKKIKSKETYL